MEPILCKKKITTIINEYYKVPENENGELYKVSPEVYSNNETVDSYPPGQPPEFDRATFTQSVVSYFESYAKKMQDLVTVANGTEDELTAAEENAFRDLWSIGVLVRPFYTAEFSERLSHLLKAILLLEIQILAYSRVGFDTKVVSDRMINFTLGDLGQLLSSYNSFYNKENIRTRWSTITSSWNDAMKAKLAKDNVKFSESINKANENLMSFASHLAQGIIQQHSSKFFEAAPAI
jgi:hypothetical protein